MVDRVKQRKEFPGLFRIGDGACGLWSRLLCLDSLDAEFAVKTTVKYTALSIDPSLTTVYETAAPTVAVAAVTTDRGTVLDRCFS